MKTCCTCKEKLSSESFYKNKAARDGLTNKCKACTKEYSSQYKRSNKAAVEEYGRAYRKDYYSKSRCEKLAWQKAYRENHLQERREYDRNYNKLRYATQKDTYVEKSARRRASKLCATPPWLDETHKRRLQSIYKACRNVTKRTGKAHHVDHIVPLKGQNVCGLHVWWNLRIVPSEMNLSKGNKVEVVSEQNW